MFAFWKKLELCWNRNSVLASMLVLAATGLTLWAYFCPQPAGISIGVLATVAGIMSVRPKMHPAEKFIWVALLIVLATVEFRAINSADRTNIADRKAENDRFDALQKQQKENFDVTVAGLHEAVDGLSKNIFTAQAIFEQTRPHAVVQFSKYVFDHPESIMSAPIAVHFYFENTGSAPATRIWKMGRVYFSSADQSSEQKSLLIAFDEDWKAKKKNFTPGKVLPAGEPLADFYGSNPLNPSEIIELTSHKSALYYLFRVQYTDPTGTWISEHCDFAEPIANGEGMWKLEARHCAFFNTPRRKLTQP